MSFISCTAALHLAFSPPTLSPVFDTGFSDAGHDPLVEHYRARVDFRDWHLLIDVKHESENIISPLRGFARVTGDVTFADGKLSIAAERLEFSSYEEHLTMYRSFDLRDPCLPGSTPTRYPSYDHVYIVFQGEVTAADVRDDSYPSAVIADVQVRQDARSTTFRCYFNRLYRMFFYQPLPLHFVVERPVPAGPSPPVSGFAYVDGLLGIRAARLRIFASDIQFFSVEDYIKTQRIWDPRDPFIRAGTSSPPLPPGDAYLVFHGYVCTEMLRDPEYPNAQVVDLAIDNGFAMQPIRCYFNRSRRNFACDLNFRLGVSVVMSGYICSRAPSQTCLLCVDVVGVRGGYPDEKPNCVMQNISLPRVIVVPKLCEHKAHYLITGNYHTQ
ncbi:hypothetical protein AURDEDRAFT_160240 [Auricularia subglabra TFB-10046 SS5]|nr:hypothetical protein AURDEDRAFT_160240 [Auricularia subglabra TFB-10046 SS5]